MDMLVLYFRCVYWRLFANGGILCDVFLGFSLGGFVGSLLWFYLHKCSREMKTRPLYGVFVDITYFLRKTCIVERSYLPSYQVGKYWVKGFQHFVTTQFYSGQNINRLIISISKYINLFILGTPVQDNILNSDQSTIY